MPPAPSSPAANALGLPTVSGSDIIRHCLLIPFLPGLCALILPLPIPCLLNRGLPSNLSIASHAGRIRGYRPTGLTPTLTEHSEIDSTIHRPTIA